MVNADFDALFIKICFWLRLHLLPVYLTRSCWITASIVITEIHHKALNGPSISPRNFLLQEIGIFGFHLHIHGAEPTGSHDDFELFRSPLRICWINLETRPGVAWVNHIFGGFEFCIEDHLLAINEPDRPTVVGQIAVVWIEKLRARPILAKGSRSILTRGKSETYRFDAVQIDCTRASGNIIFCGDIQITHTKQI